MMVGILLVRGEIMAFLYLGVMILLQVAGIDTIGGEAIQLQAFIGILFGSVAGIMKMWRTLSR